MIREEIAEVLRFRKDNVTLRKSQTECACRCLTRDTHTLEERQRNRAYSGREETIRFGRRCIRCNTRSRDRQMTTTKCNEGGAGCACGLYTRNTSDEATDTEGLVRRDYLTASCPRVRHNREKTTKEKVVPRFPLHGDTAK